MASLFYLILGCIFVWAAHNAIGRGRKRRAESKMAEAYGCQSPPRLVNQRPFGWDRIEQVFRADSESRLLELFLFHFRFWGTTLDHISFAGSQAIGTVEPANIETVLSTKFEEFGMGPRRNIMYPFFGDGIFTQHGPEWKHSRELLRPQFAHKQYEDMEVFRYSVDNLLRAIPAKGVVDLQPLFFRLTLDVTTAFLFGESVDSLKTIESAGELDFASAFNTAQDFVAKRLRLIDLYWLIGGKKFQRACDNVHQYADQIIERNLSGESKATEGRRRPKFLDYLAQNTPDRKAMRSQIINILVAGRDTTACLISWTFFLLVRHPKIMEKLRAEIASAFSGRIEMTRSELRNLNYLQNVLKETLRLYPPIAVNSRFALKTTTIPAGGGANGKSPILVRKGVSVVWSPYVMHRRPDLYGLDAELFRPERWDDETMPLNHEPTAAKFGYLPFNGGPRICLGIDFALTEAAYAVVRLIQEFPTIKLPPDQKVEVVGVEKQTMTLVLSSTNGCKVEVDSAGE